jgi:outer membrane protein assembly factor BamB
MGYIQRSLKLIKYPLLTSIILILEVSSLFAKTVNLNAEPFSGLSPLEVKFTCNVATNTSPPVSYTMNYDDGSPEETIYTTQYSCAFTHTYLSGLFLPVVAVKKDLGLSATSDPLHVIVAKWKFETNGEIDCSPAIGPDGTVYVGSDDGHLYAIDPETGSEKWRFLSGAEIQSSPAVGSDGTIYFGSLDKNFYALRANGTAKWIYNINNFIFSSPAISSNGRAVYVGASDNTIYAFNASTGTLKWKVTTGGKIVSSPGIGNDGLEDVVYVGSLDRNVYALASDNGQLKWKFSTNAEVYGSPAIGPNGKIYVGECRIGDALKYNYKLFCINVDGTKSWEFNGGTGFYSSPAIGPDGKLYIGSWDGTFYAINLVEDHVSVSWSVTLSPPRSINSSPAVGFSDGNPVLYVGSKDGNFYALQSPEVKEGEIGERKDWVFKTKDDILYSSPAIDQNGTIYFGSHDKNLYAIQPGNMNLAESPWPMFHNSPDHYGSAPSIIIPPVVSSSPTPYFNDIDVNTNQILVNFSPDIKTTQVQIDSFVLKKEGSDISDIEGQAILKSMRYNNTGYHIVAIFTPDEKELPLDYSTKYTASIKYYPTDQAEEDLYTWSFITEAEEEEDPNPSPKSDWSCFIDSLTAH